MALQIKLTQRLSQTLAMTPQLRQAIELLQLGRHEYLNVISEELLKNPLLEEVPDDGADDSSGLDSKEANGNGSGAEFGGGGGGGESTANDGASTKADARGEAGTTSSDWQETTGAGESYASGSYTSPSGRASTARGGDRPSIEATVSYREGLTSHLLWQLRTLELSDREKEIATNLVGNLDLNGLLCIQLSEVTETCGVTMAEVESVLKIVQSLDPPGIAARDLRECLLNQLSQKGLQSTLAYLLVDRHLKDLELRRYDRIARANGVKVEDVYEAIKEIRKLEPRPGRPFSEDAPMYITPDVFVRKIGDDYVISLNERGIPRLRLSRDYTSFLSDKTPSNASNRDYLFEQYRSAAGLIKSIHRRQQTIFRVTESIMKFQRAFLEEGVSALRPLVLRDVADDVSMHESTISRVTSNKYVHTPQGVFELKFFFSSGLRGQDGDVSSQSVKERIRELVAAENPKKPLSDQALVNILKAEGIDVARRTVAKYRESIGLLSSSRRKKAF